MNLPAWVHVGPTLQHTACEVPLALLRLLTCLFETILATDPPAPNWQLNSRTKDWPSPSLPSFPLSPSFLSSLSSLQSLGRGSSEPPKSPLPVKHRFILLQTCLFGTHSIDAIWKVPKNPIQHFYILTTLCLSFRIIEWEKISANTSLITDC